MEITGFLTAIFTGITAGIAVYNQVKIKQKVYTLWHNSDDCVCIDATICNYRGHFKTFLSKIMTQAS